MGRYIKVGLLITLVFVYIVAGGLESTTLYVCVVLVVAVKQLLKLVVPDNLIILSM